jgi:hypothetical protein
MIQIIEHQKDTIYIENVSEIKCYIIARSRLNLADLVLGYNPREDNYFWATLGSSFLALDTPSTFKNITLAIQYQLRNNCNVFKFSSKKKFLEFALTPRSDTESMMA